MDKNHFVSVAGLVLNDRGEVLLVKSPIRGWEFPGGMVEAGESLQTALKREIFEESGVDITITGFSGLCKNIEKDSVNIDFRCRYLRGKLTTSDESVDVQWYSPEKALAIVENPLTLKRLQAMLSSGNKVHCFAFSKMPFSIAEEDLLSVE